MKNDEYWNKIKDMIQKAGVFRIGALVVSGILLIVFSCGDFFPVDTEVEENTEEVSREQVSSGELEDYKGSMEKQVTEILEKVEGVGKADVMITLKASREKVMLRDNERQENSLREESVLVEGEEGNTEPYVVQEVEPEIEGILVVCDGGNDPALQREIIAGISALFPVESHKIKVMKSKEAKE